MSHQTTDISSQLNHPERDLALQSIENARDLGGYQTVDGGHTRFGVFVRTADMDRVVEADRVAMRDHGISLVIDLRMQREREEKPNLFSRGSLGDPAFQVHDFWGDRFDTYRSPDRSAPPAKKLADLYCAGLQASDFVMAEIIRSLASAEGAAAFHCRSGKDRTGLVAAMLLSIARVHRDVICADFSLTEQYLLSDAINPIELTAPGAWQRTCAPETMRMTLDFIDESYGDVPSYLIQAGVSEQELIAIRKKFV